MSADPLRKAAALMRERAEAATPSPWERRGRCIDGGTGGYSEVLTLGPVECMAYCYGGTSTIEGDNLEADQVHIASWHPAVALAVADWLDEAAESWRLGTDLSAEALALARAYLGDDS